MEVFSKQDTAVAPDAALKAVIDLQFPGAKDGVTYLNTGSVGRKPICVIEALNQALKELNSNPTLTTFVSRAPLERARKAAGSLLAVDPSLLLLTGNSTQGLQLIMQSFLAKPGDELVTTDHEHGSSKAIIRYLQEARGVVVRTYEVPPLFSSEQFCFDILSLVNSRTKLVLVSEIDCYTGWRPELSTLAGGLELLDVPLLVDGAHVPGHVVGRPSKYPMWVGSGHKWLGGPNGTGFVYVVQDLIPRLEPVWLGDLFFEKRDQEIYDISRFECRGTTDVCQWYGLTAAIELYANLNNESVANYQRALVSLLRNKLRALSPTFRSPAGDEVPADECTAILSFHFPESRLKVKDLRNALWADHKIWIQPDNLSDSPGFGARISCHYTVTERDIEKLVGALSGYVL